MILEVMDMDMVHRKVVVFASKWIGVGIVVDKGHMMVNGEKELVSVVVQIYVERMVYKYRVGLVGNYKGVHHIYQLGMHYRVVFAHDILEGVVA